MGRVTVVGLCAMIAACAAPFSAVGEEKYRIGVMAPLSGAFANYRKLVREGVERVRNPLIEWVFEDEACEPAKAAAAYTKLTAVDRLRFLIGPCCGTPQKTVAPLLASRDQVALLPSSAPGGVFAASGRKMFSVQYSLETEGGFLAAAMNERRLKRVAVIYDDNEFSRTLESAFLAEFKGEVVFTERAPAFDVQYMKAAAFKLRTIDFDSLFIPDAAPFLLGILGELSKAGIPRKPAFSVYSAQMPDVLAAEREHAEGLIYSYPDVPQRKDAFGYFPFLAATLLSEAVVKCGGEAGCVARSFAGGGAFNDDGTLRGRIVLKTVRGGEFVPLEE